MKRLLAGTAGSVLAIGLLVSLSGCASNNLRDERDALYTQNQELQKQAEQQQAALAAAKAEQDRLAAENARLAAQKPAPPMGEAPAPEHVVTNTGFHKVPGVEVDESVAGQVTVRVPGDVLFSPGKADVKASSEKTLDQIAAVLKKEYPTNKVRVEGYTDTDPIKFSKSKWKDNMQLSEARAKSVSQYLSEDGIPASRLTTVGFGDTKPRQTKAQSRRVEIVVFVANR